MEFTICMGCLADPIKDQVEAQGLIISGNESEGA